MRAAACMVGKAASRVPPQEAARRVMSPDGGVPYDGGPCRRWACLPTMLVTWCQIGIAGLMTRWQPSWAPNGRRRPPIGIDRTTARTSSWPVAPGEGGRWDVDTDGAERCRAVFSSELSGRSCLCGAPAWRGRQACYLLRRFVFTCGLGRAHSCAFGMRWHAALRPGSAPTVF